MGCDGGTIPKRDELVKTKKKPEQKDKAAEANFRWQHCAISQAPLQQPVVACELGRIYNKDAVIETLLNKTEESLVTVSHIKSLRDVKTLNLTENAAWTEASQKGDSYNDNNKAQWICPISGQEMNGIFRFVFLWTCGCVFSEKAQKEITSNECLKCQKPFTAADVVVLNPSEEEEIEAMRAKMEMRRSKAKDSKKAKKSAKACTDTGPIASSSTSTSTPLMEGIHKKDDSKLLSKRQESAGKRPAKIDNLEVKDAKLSKISGKYSVAKDPNVSSTYKSLFTSSETASTQQRAHWVTYNPFYN